MNFRWGSAGPELSHASFIMRLIAGALLINLFIVGMIVVSLRQSYLHYVEKAEISSRGFADLLDEEIGSDYDKIDMVLLSAADEVSRQMAAGGINGKVLNAYLQRQLERLPEAISLRVADAQGRVKYARGVLGTAEVNVADREYFIRQRDAAASGLVIARPLFARISKEWTIPVSRRISKPDGSFAGVVYVNASMGHLYMTFASLELGAHGSVALFNQEREIFSRYPAPDEGGAIGKKLTIERLQTLLQAGKDAATYKASSMFDGTRHIYSYRKLSDHPLYVITGLAEADYLADWWREVKKMTLLGVLFLLVTLWLTWLTSRAWRSQKQAALSLRNSEEQIKFMATHDALTGLPNRMLARDLFELAASFADRADFRLAVIFLDLDNFKTINDSLGHSAGDTLLKVTAQRLRDCMRDMDTLSRQGGDEFLILLSDLGDVDAVSVVVEKILRCLAAPLEIAGAEFTTSLSMGVAIYPEDGKDFDTLLKKADTAMYQAKAAGRNTYRFYAEQMNVDVTEHLRLRNGLRLALERDEFVLHYQPQINLASGAIIGVEALIRWNHPQLGMIPPDRFIPIAEDCGLIVQMGDWVLLEACRQAVLWRKAGLAEMVMAVNVSSVQFNKHNLEHSVIQALVDSGLEPACLELELTESILIQDGERVLHSIQRLKSLGVQLSIDDFGTGYSSLSYLKRFAVDKLKIDRSFVRDMASNPNDAAIVLAIIQMARSLGLRTIAEGVEDEQQLAILGLQKCDEVQGYYFARPLPAHEFMRFAQSRME